MHTYVSRSGLMLGRLLTVLGLAVVGVGGWAAEPRYDLPAVDLSVGAADSGTLYVAMDGKGAFKRRLPGGDWQTINAGITTPRILSIAVSPSDPKRLYMGTKGIGLYLSNDGGTTWRASNRGLNNSTISRIVVDPKAEGSVYLLSPAGGIFHSPDAGASWRPINEGLFFGDGTSIPEINRFYRLLLIPTSERLLFVGTKFGVYRRAGAHGTWQLVEGLPRRLCRALAYDESRNMVYATVSRELYRSADLGKSWQRAGSETWPLPLGLYVLGPEHTLYASVRGRGLLKSRDRGDTWVEANEGLPDSDVNAMVEDPTSRTKLYAALWGGGVYQGTTKAPIWRSSNQALSTELPPGFIGKRRKLKDDAPKPPSAFFKCNVCHGWVEPELDNGRKVSFYVTGTPRDWSYTVERMNEEVKWALGERHREVLVPKEERQVIQFLTEYYGSPVAESKKR